MLPAKPFSSSLSASHCPPTLVSVAHILICEEEFAVPSTSLQKWQELLGRIGPVLSAGILLMGGLSRAKREYMAISL